MSFTGPLFHRKTEGTKLITNKGGATVFSNSGIKVVADGPSIFASKWGDQTKIEQIKEEKVEEAVQKQISVPEEKIEEEVKQEMIIEKPILEEKVETA